MPDEAANPIPPRMQLGQVVLRDVLNWLDPGKLALTGLIWYGFLWIAYNEFYEPLGITPSAVGLSYATILSNSVGAAVAFLIPLLAMILLLLVLTIPTRWIGYEKVDGQYRRKEFTSITGYTFIGIGLLFIIFLGYLVPVSAGNEAQRVMRGEEVNPLHAFPSFAPVLAIQADPVTAIRSVGTKNIGEVVAVESLTATGLLYMGQANSVMVLYDSSRRQAVYLPASSVVLTTKHEK